MEFLAKPKGILLKKHTENVLNEMINIIQAHPFVFEKYFQIIGKDLSKRVKAVAKYHDDGKQHPKWQDACKKEYYHYQKFHKINGAFLKNTGIRHEMESLDVHQNHNFSEPIKVAIAAHHGKLNEKYSERWEKDCKGKYRNYWYHFKNLSMDVSTKLNGYDKLNLAVLRNYEFAGVRSYLQLADHRASISEDDFEVPKFVSFAYKFNSDWTKREVQKIAEENWDNDILLIRAPTGAGKTDACLLWANKQVENKKADRLIIAMPTRFTSNALAINVTDTLSDTGLYHSSAWFTKHYHNSKESEKAEHFAKLQHEFARILETPVTVCTIDHLLMSLTHSREDHHTITFNLANSCLVIDEADFYDEFTQANILELLKVLKILKVPVLIMSASLPESALNLYKKSGFDIDGIKEDQSDNDRIRCDIRIIKEYCKVNEIDDLIENSKKQPTIIYANTIDHAMDLYNYFTEDEKKDIILYHSRFTEPDKLKKENRLIRNFGKDTWQNGTAKGIAIMTQIGEMSVNISANYMISELCPIDRLVQRLGRLSRFDKSVGHIDIIVPMKDDLIYPAPYGNYIRNNGWVASRYLIDTLKYLSCNQFSANDLVDLVNKIYPEINDFSNTAQLNADRLEEHIVENWLILPSAQDDDDADNTHIWKSRNIETQIDIFVLDPFNYLDVNIQKFANTEKNKNKSCYFDNYKEFMYYKNQYSVSCPAYLWKKGLKSGQVYKSDKIWIGDNKDPKHVWVSIKYSSDLGLVFNDFDDSNFK